MPATVSTSFMISYCYYSSGSPVSDPLLVVDGLKTFQEAAEYAIAIRPPGNGWARYSPEKWDPESETATITYHHRVRSTAFEITICPSVKFNVSRNRYIDGVPTTIYESRIF